MLKYSELGKSIAKKLVSESGQSVIIRNLANASSLVSAIVKNLKVFGAKSIVTTCDSIGLEEADALLVIGGIPKRYEFGLDKKWMSICWPLDEQMFNACIVDYKKLCQDIEWLKSLVDKTDCVRIVAKDTDIILSIKGYTSMVCDGTYQLPGGEICMGVVRESVNGKILFNIPSLKKGVLHENVMLEFENGKVIRATSSNQEAIDALLATDNGARYLGEFAIGINPLITVPTLNGSADEKMSGSIHLALGDHRSMSDNGNRSAIHWDLVQSHKIQHGGGEIWFDGVLVCKDGVWLQCGS